MAEHLSGATKSFAFFDDDLYLEVLRVTQAFAPKVADGSALVAVGSASATPFCMLLSFCVGWE